ncbi:MAG: right-handed parallel beta-helix repeat-containing protein [bacterium]
MHTLTALALLISVSFTTVSLGQTDVIGVYDDEFSVNCGIDDDIPRTLVLHVVHTSSAGAVMSRFRAPAPDCFTGIWLSDTAVFGNTTGDSQTGVEIGYGSCESGTWLVLSINYFALGTTPNCCPYPVVSYPSTVPGVIEVVDCDLNTLSASGYTNIVNKNAGCDCCLPGTISVPPYASIQAAVDAACPGDTIVLADSTYTGAGNRDVNIDKPITIRSASGNPNLCVIDCQGSEADPHSGFLAGPTAGAVNVKGITIRGALGSTSPSGYGIYCNPDPGYRASLTLNDCRLTDNGIGLYANFCDASIVNCEFDTNTNIGGLFKYDGNVVMDSCVVRDNDGVGIFTMEGTSLSLSNSLVAGNITGIEVEERGTANIDNCEIIENDFSGAAILVDSGSITNSRIASNGGPGVSVCGADVDIIDTVIENNADGALRVSCSSQYISLNNCTVYGNSGTIIDGAPPTPSGFTYIGISRCIIAFNPSTQTMDSPDSLFVECTDIYGMERWEHLARPAREQTPPCYRSKTCRMTKVVLSRSSGSNRSSIREKLPVRM